jgi:hypothetical protein
MNKITHYLFATALVATGGLFAACDDDSKSSGILVNEISVAEATAGGGALMELVVKEAEKLQLTTTILPLDAAYRRALYESSDPGIFTVTQAGVITGEAFGNATLHVFSADGGGAATDYTVIVDYRAGVVNVRTPGTLSQLLNAFSGTELLLAGTLNEEDMRTLSAAARDRALTSIDMSLANVPNNTLKGDGTTGLFESASSLETVILPNTLTAIGDYCFQNAVLTTLTLPVSVSTIGQYAFNDAGLTSLTLARTTPPSVAENAFDGINLTNLKLTVPQAAAGVYRETEVWQRMTINGVKPAARVSEYTIPAATGVGAWVTIPLDATLLTTDSWEIRSVSTQVSDDINVVTFGGEGWGVHLLRLVYTGTINGGVIGNGLPTEFYLGGTSQGGTKIGAVGRGNWHSTTTSLDPPAIALNKPLTITLECIGDGVISCYIQNEGINGGARLPFGTLDAASIAITGVEAAIATVTTVTVTRE